jgi:hypothetical protein
MFMLAKKFGVVSFTHAPSINPKFPKYLGVAGRLYKRP